MGNPINQHVPQPPPETRMVITPYVPHYLAPLAMNLSNGLGETHNGITFDIDGNLVFDRKLTPEDQKLDPILEDVNELWICLDMPTS